MDELGSLWSYQEGTDELNQKLLCTTIELETLKVEASEEMRKHKEEINHLIDLLKMAYKERDEAKDQLQKLFNKLMPENSLVIPIKANSSITESNSLSDTYNHQSMGSSPVDSLFDAVASPDISSINMADSGLVPSLVPSIDPADSAIDSLVRGKVLPMKGKLLQAVLESGPLLRTLLFAGPLPQWRNPPPPLESFRIPPVSIRGYENAYAVYQKPSPDSDSGGKNKKSMNIDMSRGCSQMCSASMLNFTSDAYGSGSGNPWTLNSGCINQIPPGKRQRFH